MKNFALVVVLVLLGVIGVSTPAADAGHYWYRHPAFGWGWYGVPFYGLPYYPPAYVPPPQIIIEREQSQPYTEQQAQPQQQYWYWCKNPEGYYPYVAACPSGWMQVVPQQSPPTR